MKAGRIPGHRFDRILGQSVTAALGAFLGVVISQGLTLYTFRVNLRTSRDIQMINLARELDKDFVGGQTFQNIRVSIDRCDKLYTSWGGKFDNDQINQYLNFFDDLGFYWGLGDLSDAIVDQMFGPYIVEAYEYQELRRYISEFHKNTGQKKAFENFEKLAQSVERNSDFAEMLVAARKCANSALEKTGVP